MLQDIWRWSATRITTAVRSKDISCREVVQAHLDRIDAVNPTLNAITVTFAEEALAVADAADRVPFDQRGPLHGLPITVKENIDVTGSATTHGLVSRADAIAKHDAPVIAHLKTAGAIILGRTNMPDYGLRWHTDSGLHGATRNPWDPTRTPGGSSGGEAVALATGMSPLGIGNDMGGSTRQPAINCGVAGLRPTTGRVSSVMDHDYAYAPSFYEQVAAVNGPMARTVADLRLALTVMSQPDPLDPLWTGGTAPPCPPERAHNVGLIRDPSGIGLDPGVAQALDISARSLRDAGYTVEDISLPFLTEAEDTIDTLFTNESFDMEAAFALMSSDAVTVARAAIKPGTPNARDYFNAIAKRHSIAVDCARIMERYPLLLGPVSTLQPFEVGYDLGGPEVMRRLIRSFRLTEFCNLVGLPALACPVCLTNGVPQGVQLIGRQFDEDRCVSAAEVIEARAALTTPIDPRSGAG